jgi:hypothetical protein
MEGADVALLNSGGLRADLPAGELEYGAVYEIIPFDNNVATITMTGRISDGSCRWHTDPEGSVPGLRAEGDALALLGSGAAARDHAL